MAPDGAARTRFVPALAAAAVLLAAVPSAAGPLPAAGPSTATDATEPSERACPGLQEVACVHVEPTSKVGDLHRPSVLDPPVGLTVEAELGLLGVYIDPGLAVAQELAWATVDGDPEPDRLLDLDLGPVRTTYQTISPVCVGGQCQLVVDEASSTVAGEKVGELWRAELLVIVGGNPVVDVPFLTVTAE